MPTTHSCIICLEIIDSNFATLKTCGHVFHYGCVQQWITQSKTCPTCRIRTSSHQVLTLFVEAVPTVDVEELLKNNQTLAAQLEEKQTVNEALQLEKDILQQKNQTMAAQLEEKQTVNEALLLEKDILQQKLAEKRKQYLVVERKLRERTRKLLNKESRNRTIDLTDSPPPVPESQKKGLKRRKSADGDCTIDLTDSPPPATEESRRKRSKRNEAEITWRTE